MKRDRHTWAIQKFSAVRWAKDRMNGKGVVKKVLKPESLIDGEGSYIVMCDDGVERTLEARYLTLDVKN